MAAAAEIAYFRDMQASQKRGRPSLYKKGAMTAAERQWRHRKKLAGEVRKVKEVAARARRQEAKGRLAAPEEFPEKLWIECYQRARDDVFAELIAQRPLCEPEGEADRLATQIAEWLVVSDITIEEVRAAIDRRFGRL